MKGTAARGIRFVRLLLPLAVVGCADMATPPAAVQVASAPVREVAHLTCQASVQQKSVVCEPAAPSPAEGLSSDQLITGGQHRNVALASSGVTYVDEVFSFQTTVRNLLTLPMATADGAARDGRGLRVFFHELPTATAGSGAITVANPTGTDIFTASNQIYFQYGGAIEGVDQNELGADGILTSAETSASKSWHLNVPSSVDAFTFSVLVATEMPSGPVVSIAPEVTSVSPAVLTPGSTATIAGARFNSTPGLNSVTIGGVAATVTGGTETELTVTVPCTLSGSVPVVVASSGVTGVGTFHPLVVPTRTVPVGGMVLVSNTSEIGCNEIASANGPARYIMSVFSNSTSPSSSAPFRISADLGNGDALVPVPEASLQRLTPGRPSLAQVLEQTQEQINDERHERLLEENREFLETYGPSLRNRPRASSDGTVSRDLSANRTFRIPNIAGTNICRNFYVVAATQVYLDGKIAIYEDDAMADAFKAANNVTMAENYERIGDQFNADMEPIIREYFGDVLRRDELTDDNGVIIVLVSPRLNNSFAGTAGFVASCDQFANDDTSAPEVGGPYAGEAGSTNASSNHAEIFYSYAPTVAGSGYNAGNTPDNWYRTIRSTFIHETKHLAAYSARVANGASSFEASWLEEATARHSEELWGRLAVDNLGWKANNGYGSATSPSNIYCDVRPSGWAECDANSRRPASIMQRHFTSLYTFLFGQNARLLSPFGAAPSDNASYFYAIGWSLVRHAADRYALDEAAFFQALTQANQTGADNLLARTGSNIDELLAGWSLALAVDDHPLLAAPATPALQFATWNFRDIYAGLNGDFPGTYSLAYPLVPAAQSFGSIAPVSVTTLRGGGSLWYELSGEQTGPQLIRLEANGGGAPPSSLRLAITRVE